MLLRQPCGNTEEPHSRTVFWIGSYVGGPDCRTLEGANGFSDAASMLLLMQESRNSFLAVICHASDDIDVQSST